jgi:hypothetical protein
MLLAGILIFVIMAGICYGIMYVIGWIPGPTKRGKEIARRIADESHHITQRMMRPILIPRAIKSVVVETIRYLASVFKKEG